MFLHTSYKYYRIFQNNNFITSVSINWPFSRSYAPGLKERIGETKQLLLSLPGTRRDAFVEWLKRNKKAITAGFIAWGIICVNYYRNHLDYTPITKRSRFIALTKEQFGKVCQKELEEMRKKYKDSFVPINDPNTTRVVRILSRLVNRNRIIPEVNRVWTVVLVDSPERHSRSISTGYILVTTAMLKSMTNDDQLAILLSHEMAHAMLQHDLEKISWATLVVDVFKSLIDIFLSLVPGDYLGQFVDGMREKVLEVILNLPYGRLIEREADELGLELVSRACFDPREAYAYWTGLLVTPRREDMNQIVAKWVYYHPNYGDRSERLEEIMEKLCQIRSSAGCPPVAHCDPCALLEMKRKLGQMDDALSKEGCPL